MPLSVIAVLPNSSDSNLISESLGRDGIAVLIVPSPERALELLGAAADDSVVLYDADTGQLWQDVLPCFFAARPNVQVVLLTQFPSRQMWLDLFDQGGFDVVVRPFRPGDLRTVVRCALDPPRLFRKATA